MAELTPDGIRFGNYTEQTTAEYPAFRNLIINGDMRVAQRGVLFTAVSSGSYTVDRWKYVTISTSVATITQSIDSPTNFSNSLMHTVTTADTVVAVTDLTFLEQPIEGYTATELIDNTFTVSFWVRSSKTGVHCLNIRNVTPGTASFIAEYTITASNTWEYKSITITNGLPNQYAWGTVNDVGCRICFALAAGENYQNIANIWTTTPALATANQVNCLDTVGNIFAITGVQLEKSPGATPFEFRNYDVELLLCQRYYSVSSASMRWGSPGPGQAAISPLYWPVVMRIAPTVTFNNHAGTTFVNGNNDFNVSSKSAINITVNGAGFLVNSINAGDTYSVYQSALASAEL